jgi:hypothetical protein
MGLFQRNRDPLKKRAKSVQNKLNELHSQIQDLDEKPAQASSELHYLKQNDQSLPRRPSTMGKNQPLDTKAQRPEKLWDRMINNFRKPPVSTNPKMVNFLAAGSIQGLRPLRYERRVARNRFLAFTTVLVLILIGLFWTLIKQ